MKFSYSKILYTTIIIGILISFLKQGFYTDNFPILKSLNTFVYYFTYLLILISTFSLTITNDKWSNNKILKNLYFILIAIFFSWLYGITVGFIKEGSNTILVLRNYLFLSLSLPAYLIFSKISVKGIIEFSLKLPFIIAPLSFLQIIFAIRGLPSFFKISNTFFNNEFSRNLFAYTYVHTSYIFFACLIFSIAFKFERYTFQKILEKFNILKSKNSLIINSYRFFIKYNSLSIFWFIWVTILAYFGNASIVYLFFSIILYSFSKFKRYKFLFISFLVIILIFTAPYIYNYFITYYGSSRLFQIVDLYQNISLFGNGLGSEIFIRGKESYSTEVLILGVIVQLGIFAIPFIFLIITFLKNIFILAWKADSLSLLLALSYGGYLSTLFSNPTISYPWTYLFTINGVILSEILKTKGINQIIDD